MTAPATTRRKGEVTRSDPATEFMRLTQQFSGLFDGRWPDISAIIDREAFTPLSDIEEADDAYQIDIELPGIDKKDVNVEVVDQRLTVTGERRVTEPKGRLRHRSIVRGKFFYEVSLPERVDPEHVEATLRDGVLHVRVPKSQGTKHRQIEIH